MVFSFLENISKPKRIALIVFSVAIILFALVVIIVFFWQPTADKTPAQPTSSYFYLIGEIKDLKETSFVLELDPERYVSKNDWTVNFDKNTPIKQLVHPDKLNTTSTINIFADIETGQFETGQLKEGDKIAIIGQGIRIEKLNVTFKDIEIGQLKKGDDVVVYADKKINQSPVINAFRIDRLTIP